jgi:flagellar biosynthetic protein FliR
MEELLALLDEPAVKIAIERAILLGALVTARVAPIVQLVPYLGGKATPQTVKLGLSMAITALVFPLVFASGAADALPNDPISIGALVLKEALLGVAFGFVASLVFEATRVAGQLIDNARGQTQATAFAPQLPERVSVSADLLYQLSALVFVLLGGHQLLIAALLRSYVSIPPHQFPALGENVQQAALAIARLGADAITLGVLLAFPVTAAILLTEVVLAFVNRAAPQINVFFLGMPLKACVGLGALVFALDAIIGRVMNEAVSYMSWVERLLAAI